MPKTKPTKDKELVVFFDIEDPKKHSQRYKERDATKLFGIVYCQLEQLNKTFGKVPKALKMVVTIPSDG